MRALGRLAGGNGGAFRGILNGSGGVGGGAGGYFKLDGKEGLLTGMGVGAGAGSSEKSD